MPRLRGVVQLGKVNQLEVVKQVDFGYYLDGQELGEILLPHSSSETILQEGDIVDAFLYKDSEDRLIATTRTPLAQVGEVTTLKVSAVTSIGAFLDWGLEKELLVPFAEQGERMVEGQQYLVVVYVDVSNRIVASSKLDKRLDREPAFYKPHQAVDIVICDHTDIGYKAAINGAHWGVLYRNEVFKELRVGYKTKAYINRVRDDGKIDLLLEKPGYSNNDELANKIIKFLKQNQGFSHINDKSSPEIITRIFGVSKKKFKQSLGNLLKQGQISIESDGIRLK
ncbi:S1 RNA-binding domain-containing protein [Psychrobium sp. 1_MG-2023]|uniref:CvfB family protein n=1 Tax=Psychrobium sp. 1_MG-2023 TaxID=3062624 RepID=UPI000C33B74A|nr:S1-like domain-containing RNA-binding protein [Psychrobium sp. 1_MG-2023]MDP2561444.1 S1-like domain-containing RNA-binding protein [Psychrobium sp. 1_MG-2023]PKF57711.1 GntR family transcriptional regulator [Alteromonadales bacterium alter-6D02]